MTIQDAEYEEYNTLSLISQDFFYKSDGYSNVSKFNKTLFVIDNDLVGDERSIRIYGTKKQIDLAANE